MNVLPGDTATIYAGVNASPERVEQIRHELGLDKPVFIQYLHFLKKVLLEFLQKTPSEKKYVKTDKNEGGVTPLQLPAVS